LWIKWLKIIRIPNALDIYGERHDEIEEPIQDMHAGFDDLEEHYAVNNSATNFASQMNVPTLHKFYVESNMRKVLKTDEAHAANSVDTAKRILNAGDLGHINMDPQTSEILIRNFGRIGQEMNGKRFLKGLGTTGAAALGGFAGGVKLGLPGAIAGAVGGGILGHVGLGALMNNGIQNRDEDIYDNREAAFQNAYDKIKARHG
jgi:hypothetical protein